jgi:uncharacterized membrane protein
MYRNSESKTRNGLMKILRFAVIGLCAFGIVACAIAVGRLAGVVPPSKLPPYPAWTVAHFASAAPFLAIVPLQLWPAFRRRLPHVHRILGRVAVALGVVIAASGVSIAFLAPARPVSEQIFMSAFFASYLTMLALGLRAALRRDIPAHQAWMVRMTATALTPLTQRLVFPIFAGSLGIDGLPTFWQLFVSAAWLAWGLNLTVAESWLRASERTPRMARA